MTPQQKSVAWAAMADCMIEIGRYNHMTRHHKAATKDGNVILSLALIREAQEQQAVAARAVDVCRVAAGDELAGNAVTFCNVCNEIYKEAK